MELTDLVTRCVNRRQLEGIQTFVLEVEDPVAVQTHEMMVLMDLRVKTRRVAWMANPIDNAYANQRLKHPIHGCPGHPRQSPLDSIEYLFGAGMILTRQDGLQDNPPLYR